MEKLVIIFLIYVVVNVVKFISQRATDAIGQPPKVLPPPGPDQPEAVLSEIEAYLAGDRLPPGAGQPGRESAPRSGPFLSDPQGSAARPELVSQRKSGSPAGRQQASRKKNPQGARGSEKSGRSATQTRSGRLPEPAGSGVPASQRGQRPLSVTPTSTGNGVRAHVDQHMRNQIEQQVRQDLGTDWVARTERMDLRSESPSALDQSGRSASLTELLRSPEGIRQAFLVSEILSRPRVFQRVGDRAL